MHVNRELCAQEQNNTSNILSVIPLEDSKIYEQAQMNEDISLSPYPDTSQIYEAVTKQEPLQDNSMVLQQQPSEQPTKPSAVAVAVQAQLAYASSFTDQTKAGDNLVCKTEPTARKVSTMIALGAPKGDNDVRDQYKQMLMAKLDIKTIQKRRSGRGHSPKP